MRQPIVVELDGAGQIVISRTHRHARVSLTIESIAYYGSIRGRGVWDRTISDEWSPFAYHFHWSSHMTYYNYVTPRRVRTSDGKVTYQTPRSGYRPRFSVELGPSAWRMTDRVHRYARSLFVDASTLLRFRQLILISAIANELRGSFPACKQPAGQSDDPRLVALQALDPHAFREGWRANWRAENEVIDALRLLGDDGVRGRFLPQQTDDPWELVRALARCYGRVRISWIGCPVTYLEEATDDPVSR